jgi:uncharacterized protein YcfL
MRKLFISIVLILLLFVVSGCTSSTKSIYDNNNSSLSDNNNLAKIDYPDTVILDNNTTNKSINTDMENYFKTNKITEYKYSTVGNKLQVWIADFDSMTDTAQARIKSDLKKFNDNITDIEFVKNKTDIK